MSDTGLRSHQRFLFLPSKKYLRKRLHDLHQAVSIIAAVRFFTATASSAEADISGVLYKGSHRPVLAINK